MNDDLNDEDIPEVDQEEEQEQYEKDLSKSEKAKHNSDVRKRIEELLAKKRLKDLLDDADDWDF